MKSNKTKNLVVQLAVLIILIVTLGNDITEATTLSELKKQEQQADKQTEVQHNPNPGPSTPDKRRQDDYYLQIDFLPQKAQQHN